MDRGELFTGLTGDRIEFAVLVPVGLLREPRFVRLCDYDVGGIGAIFAHCSWVLELRSLDWLSNFLRALGDISAVYSSNLLPHPAG